jgi:DNA-binding NtrC family response regulator
VLIRVHVVADPDAERERLVRLMHRQEVVLSSASGETRLLEQLSGADIDLLVVHQTALAGSAENAIHSVRSLPERPEVVVLTDREDGEERASLLGQGCVAVLNRSLTDAALRRALAALIERRREEATNRLRADRPEEQYSLNDFVSESPTMQVFLDLARKVVRADASLLLLGETGVGKERLARAIHVEGPRSNGPFMALNCGALPETLLESELFGHEEGAFTGATRSRRGYFELAHGGTIFLDEIGEMPPHLQVKLLHVLDQHRIQRVGGEKPVRVDVRVMAATNRDLESEVKARRFRADLFFRLAVVTLEVPPLRERREDVPPLVSSYLEHFRVQTGRALRRVNERAMGALVSYDWPGNVRELVNTMERAVLLASGTEIDVKDLPARIVAGETIPTGGGDSAPWRFASVPEELLDKPLPEARRDIVAAFEARYLRQLLESSGGRIGETAERAGLNPRSLYEIMKRHGLRKESFRSRSAGHRRRMRADS